ncbi:MAG: hypothetical protein ACREAY_11590 [Nitrososphaera sp.]|uniref:hypothetical protein n=1 Tax=Nitrososphaera sp. TaxID=1971748 RepID=UPI003D6F1624
MKTALALGLALLPLLFAVLPAYAHSEIEQGDVTIVAGWAVEPPLQGQANAIVLEVTQGGDPATNAFENAEVTIRKGGISKVLDIKPGEEAGAYSADIIPTQLGQYSIEIKGDVAGQDFDGVVEIEDVGDARSLNFPEAGDGGQGVPEDFIEQMRGVITDLTTQVEGARGSSQDARDAAQSAAESAAEVRASADRAYLVGMVGIGAGVAGIAIAVVALRRA